LRCGEVVNPLIERHLPGFRGSLQRATRLRDIPEQRG
jgi:hypothetical protein